jgi:hypothetical protein
VAVATNPFFIVEGLFDGLSQADADVLDGVVLIDLEVSFGFDFQIEGPVPSEELEHVIEKADAGLPAPVAAAVQVELQADLGFAGVAGDRSGSGHFTPSF